MSKSTAAQALASLSYKFQAKIREVGALKAQIKRITANAAEGIAKDEVVAKLTTEIQRLRLRNATLGVDCHTLDKALNLSEFELAQAAAAYGRLQSHTRDVDGVLKELRGDVSNWKSLAAVLFVVGVAVGTLGALGYVTKVAGI